MEIKYSFYREIDSTNSECQRILSKAGALHDENGELTEEGLRLNGTVVASGKQSAGRGRLGRTFYSPEGKGIYFSVIYVPRHGVTDAALYTVSAAVCVRRAIGALSGKDALIKWVNDIYVEQKKVCGILSEGFMCSGSRIVDAVIIGVGINIFADEQMPSDIVQKAGAVFGEAEGISFAEKCSGFSKENDICGDRESLLPGQQAFLEKCVQELTAVLDSEKSVIPEYRKYSMITGKKVTFSPVIDDKEKDFEATVVDITDDAGLVVELADGTQKTFRSGEISLHSM